MIDPKETNVYSVQIVDKKHVWLPYYVIVVAHSVIEAAFQVKEYTDKHDLHKGVVSDVKTLYSDVVMPKEEETT